MSAELVIDQLRATVGGVEVLRGVDLVVRSGEVHAIMGPNGSGKSTLAHVLLGRPGYTVTGGAVTLDGVDLLELAPHQRARAGVFGALQYPVEVPGVALTEVLAAALTAADRSVEFPCQVRECKQSLQDVLFQVGRAGRLHPKAAGDLYEPLRELDAP